MRKRKPTGKSLAAIAALLITLAITLLGSRVSAMELTTSESTEATTQQTETQETVIHEDAVSFTPDGNLTLIDDFTRTDESDKQFITVKTRDESVYYIVIDRSANQENVYFLNLVDDQDLIAILNDEGLTEEIEAIAELPDPQEPEQAKPSPTKPETTDPDSSPTAMQLVVILVFVAAIGGAAFWLIRSKPFQKQRKKEVTIPEYLYEEHEPDQPSEITDTQNYDTAHEKDDDQETSTDQESEDY
jgi:flagellar basal body-associated protein FliL